jgi:hypothetical protein
VSGTADYSLSAIASDILSLTEVYLYMNGTRWVKLKATTPTELDIQEDGWKSVDSAVPDQYWYDIQLNNISLYPKPNADNAGTGYVKLYYCQKYTHLTADTGTPVLPVFLHTAMADYLVATGFERKGDDRNSIAKAANAWSQYHKRIHDYFVESHREKEDEDIIMRGYRNI